MNDASLSTVQLGMVVLNKMPKDKGSDAFIQLLLKFYHQFKMTILQKGYHLRL